jgi:uncharacterized protein YndB with AHSA1/START domain
MWLVMGVSWANSVWIALTDPSGTKLWLNVEQGVRLRPHQGGCVIYLTSGNQHVRETCQQVLKLLGE